MRRYRQQLSMEDCESQLQAEPRGVLAVLGDDGYPYTVPMDFFYDDGRLYFHGAAEGHKLDAIRRCEKASFCVLDQGAYDEGDCIPHFKSVVAFGRIHVMEDPAKALRFARALGTKYLPLQDVEEELAIKFSRMIVYEMEIEHLTGKLVYEI